MKRARVVPYRRAVGAPTGLALVIDDGTSSAWEVGRLVDLPAPVEDRRSHVQTKERVITDADIATVVSAAVALLVAHAVGEVDVETARGEGVDAQRSRRVADALVPALTAAGITAIVLGASLAIPSTPLSVAAAETSIALVKAMAETTAEEPAPPPPTVTGPRVAGIDPGSRYVAIVIGEGDVAPLRFVARRTFDVGRRIALKKPKTTASGAAITHRREVTDKDVDDLIGEVLAFMHEHHVERVVIERATYFHAGQGGAAAFGAAAGLARGQWIGGELAGALRVAARVVEGERRRFVASVESVSSKKWRGAIGKAWREKLQSMFSTWPASINVHEIDAAGLAIFAVPTKKKSAPRTKRTGPKPKRVRASANAHAARAAKRAALRAALGCTCKSNRHRRDCPANGATINA